MATENSSESQDEITALKETEPAQDVQEESGAVAKQSGSKLTLYHWTQSFNSQKVSVGDVSGPQSSGQLLITALIRVATWVLLSSLMCTHTHAPSDFVYNNTDAGYNILLQYKATAACLPSSLSNFPTQGSVTVEHLQVRSNKILTVLYS